MSGRPELGATRLPAHGSSPGGRPVIKQPTWTPEIPAYFYTGGLAGASAALGLASDLAGDHATARRAWAVALVGSVVSPALLISDLGVPSRFLHMLRMFKVTSPMSVGSWILAGYATATAPAAAHSLLGGRLGAVGRGAQVASATLGLPLASYTAALIANTAVPVWHHARFELPFVFTAGAAMSAGAVVVAVAPVAEAASARRLAIGGGVAEIVLTQVMERRLRSAGVGEPYHEGTAGRLARTATALSAAGVGLLALRAKRSRGAAIVAGLLLTGGAVAERFAIFHAGVQSAARPHDTIDPQRSRIRAGETRGAARASARTTAPDVGSGDRQPGQRPVPGGSPAIDGGRDGGRS